jgi:RHS repeat-associated protein
MALLNDTQVQTGTFSYWPYGEDAGRAGITNTRFAYVGTLGYSTDASVDSDARLYVRARYLHSTHARWLTQDPIGFEGGDFNLYRYVRNNPNNGTDATGEHIFPIKDCKKFTDRPGKIPCTPSVLQAAKSVCSIILNRCPDCLAATGCVSKSRAECLIEWCRKGARITCFKDSICHRESDPSKQLCGFSCTVTNSNRGHPNWGIAICLPIAKTNRCNVGSCSNSLRGVILHEMLGVCGSPHEGGQKPFLDPCDKEADCLCNALKI